VAIREMAVWQVRSVLDEVELPSTSDDLLRIDAEEIMSTRGSRVFRDHSPVNVLGSAARKQLSVNVGRQTLTAGGKLKRGD
jgi:hypothetical protein